MNEDLTVFVVKLFRALLHPFPNTEAQSTLHVGGVWAELSYRLLTAIQNYFTKKILR